MRSGIKIKVETVENGAVITYGDRKRVCHQFEDLVQFLAEHLGEKVHGQWEPRDQAASRR